MNKNCILGISTILKNRKSALFAVALILILAAGIFAVIPVADAHNPPLTIPTYAFLSVAPNPVGVGQQTFVNFWLNLPPPTASGTYGDRWQNYTVTVTKPDGTTETLGPFTSDAVGGAHTIINPDAIGTYTFVFHFPGQTLAGANPPPIGHAGAPDYVGDYFEPSTSSTVSLVVQQQQVQSYPQSPLPTGYWQRPIEAVNGEWYQISGNWLGLGASTFAMTGMYNASGNYNPYTKAPNTAHILWTMPEGPGGLVGGEFGGSETSNYYSTAQYEPKFAPIILNGVLYYTQYPGSAENPTGWVAVNLRTGQTLWTKDTSDLLIAGQALHFVSMNQYGSLAYLWSSNVNYAAASIPSSTSNLTFSMWDAMTGNYILSISGVVRMTFAEDSEGNLLGYYVNSTDHTLNMWNSTQCITAAMIKNAAPYASFNYRAALYWRPPQGETIPFAPGIMWSMPIATSLSGQSIPNLGLSVIASDVIVLTGNPATLFGWTPGWHIEAGYNANTGQQLWLVNRTETPWTRITVSSLGAGDGVYAEYTEETMSWCGYSLSTGDQLWGPVADNTNAWSYYGVQSQVADGVLYSWDFGGCVNAYNITTGVRLWSWHTGSSGYETPYGIWPLWTFTVGTVADGKLFVPEGHMYSPPLFHGAQQLALSTSTGQPVWSILSFDVTSAPAIADGVMVTLNAYDNQIYAYGQGQTATTVSASPGVGNVVTLQGSVTDQSPGQTCLGIPEAGTPAVSDSSMSAWMEYLYMQQPMPTNATGVPVTLQVTDSSGNIVSTINTQTDASGHYTASWTPSSNGVYTINAVFAGSESYYASSGETGIAVGSGASAYVSPSSSVSPSPVLAVGQGPITEVYVAIAAVIVIIVIIAVALVLRRKSVK